MLCTGQYNFSTCIRQNLLIIKLPIWLLLVAIIFPFHRIHSTVSHPSTHHFFPYILNLLLLCAESRCKDYIDFSQTCSLISHFQFLVRALYILVLILQYHCLYCDEINPLNLFFISNSPQSIVSKPSFLMNIWGTCWPPHNDFTYPF